MYTMLMMMAVSSGGEAPAFGGHKASCQGASCVGTVAAAPAGCTGNSCDGGRGGFLGLCRKKDNCSCTGTVVAAPASCQGSSCQGASCTGGSGFLGLKAHFANKHSCQGGTGCTGTIVSYTPVAGCAGTIVTMPVAPVPTPTPTPMPKTTETPKPKTTNE